LDLRRKAAVVIAVSNGWILRAEACRRYHPSEEELLAWENAFTTYGDHGLRGTRLQQDGRPPGAPASSLRGGILNKIRLNTRVDTNHLKVKVLEPTASAAAQSAPWATISAGRAAEDAAIHCF
jgi:hypothetical protein